jgi:hypothetical protein
MVVFDWCYRGWNLHGSRNKSSFSLEEIQQLKSK